MKKLLVMMGLLGIFVIGNAEPFRDERGVVLMKNEEWFKFFSDSDDDETALKCSMVGANVMEKGYITDGNMRDKTLQENEEMRQLVQERLIEMGEVNISKGKLTEFYYAKNCKKLTDNDYELVGSKTFKKEMERIFRTYK